MPRAAQTLAAFPSLPPLSRLLVEIALRFATWDDRRRTRRALDRLDAHMLHDIGLNPATRQAECLKPFWQD